MPADVLRDLGKDTPAAETATAPEQDVPIKSLLDLIGQREKAFQETFGTPTELKAQKEAAEQKATKAEATAEAVYQGVAEPAIVGVVKAARAPFPEIPKAIPEPPAPSLKAREYLDVPEKNALSALVTGLGVMGQLAMAGKAPVAALHALTGAMEGWHQGDAERAQRDWRQYLTTVDQIRRENRENMVRFEAAMQVHGANITAAQADLVASMALAGHYQQAAAIARQGVIPAYNQMADAVAHGDKVMDHTLKVVEAQENRKLRAVIAESAMTQRSQMHADAMAKSDRDYSLRVKQWQHKLDEENAFQLTPEDLNKIAKVVAHGVPMSTFSFGMGTRAANYRAQIIHSVMSDPNTTSEGLASAFQEYRALQAGLTKNTVMGAQIGAFIETSKQIIGQAREASKAVDRTGVPVLNRWILAGRQKVEGDKAVTDFDLLNTSVAAEWARIMNSATGGGMSTVDARQHALEVLNTAQTTEQYSTALDRLEKEYEARVSGFEKENQKLLKNVQSIGTQVDKRAPQAERKAKVKGPDGTVRDMTLVPGDVLPPGYTEQK